MIRKTSSHGLISYNIEDALLIPNPRNRRAIYIYKLLSLNKVVFVEGVCLNVAYIYCHFNVGRMIEHVCICM